MKPLSYFEYGPQNKELTEVNSNKMIVHNIPKTSKSSSIINNILNIGPNNFVILILKSNFNQELNAKTANKYGKIESLLTYIHNNFVM